MLDRIHVVGAPVRSTPAERSHRRHPVGAVALRRLEAEAEPECAGRVEQGAGLVVRHEVDRVRREDADAIQLAAVEQHLEEAGVVGGGRDQSRAPREAAARAGDVIPLTAWPVGRAMGVIG